LSEPLSAFKHCMFFTLCLSAI